MPRSAFHPAPCASVLTVIMVSIAHHASHAVQRHHRQPLQRLFIKARLLGTATLPMALRRPCQQPSPQEHARGAVSRAAIAVTAKASAAGCRRASQHRLTRRACRATASQRCRSPQRDNAIARYQLGITPYRDVRPAPLTPPSPPELPAFYRAHTVDSYATPRDTSCPCRLARYAAQHGEEGWRFTEAYPFSSHLFVCTGAGNAGALRCRDYRRIFSATIRCCCRPAFSRSSETRAKPAFRRPSRRAPEQRPRKPAPPAAEHKCRTRCS